MYYYNNYSYDYHIGDPLPTLPPGQVTSQSVPALPPLPTNSPLVPNSQATTTFFQNLMKYLPSNVKNADGTLNWTVVAQKAKQGATWAVQAMQARKQAQTQQYNGGGINPPGGGNNNSGGGNNNNAPKDNTLMYALIGLVAIALLKKQ